MVNLCELLILSQVSSRGIKQENKEKKIRKVKKGKRAIFGTTTGSEEREGGEERESEKGEKLFFFSSL